MKGWSFRALIVFALAVVCALVFLSLRQVPVEAAYPLEKAKRAFCGKVLTRVRGCFRGAEACAENLRLRRELDMLRLMQTEMERVEEDNCRLRNALGYSERKKGSYIAAGILSKGGGAVGMETMFRIDKGSLAGVAEGAAVVVPEGLVGRVESVTPHTARVVVVSDPSVRVACEIELSSTSVRRGIIIGGGEDVLLLRHLTGGGEIPARSRVVTSGLGGVFPRGIEIGTYVGADEVLPSVDYSSLQDVFVCREK